MLIQNIKTPRSSLQLEGRQKERDWLKKEFLLRFYSRTHFSADYIRFVRGRLGISNFLAAGCFGDARGRKMRSLLTAGGILIRAPLYPLLGDASSPITCVIAEIDVAENADKYLTWSSGGMLNDRRVILEWRRAIWKQEEITCDISLWRIDGSI